MNMGIFFGGWDLVNHLSDKTIQKIKYGLAFFI
jgi:hypothetical protein